MSTAYNPRIITEGLTYYFDAGNSKSVPKTNILSAWTEYGGGSSHYEILGDYSIKLKNDSTSWVGYYPANVTSTGRYVITFTYYSDVDGSYVFLDNDGIMENTYNVSLLTNTTPQIHTGVVNVTTTGDILHYIRRGSGGNIFVTNVSYFKLEDSCNNLIGNGSNGTLVNGVSYNASNGGSFGFDGIDDYVTAGALSGSFASFTVIIWFYPTSVTSHENPIDCNYSYNETTGNIGPRLEMNDGGNLTWLYSDKTDTNNSFYFHTVVSSGLSANTWHCACITFNGTGSTTYYNGNPTGITSTIIGTPTGFIGVVNNVTLGRGFHLGGADRIFTGRVSNVSIYNRALTDSEIQQNFNATRGRYGV